ncbi:TfuA-like protein [Streptomyces sp. NPDC093252]|uniref:TfuA-like protein n=1 Tax=Streptomyces sp. NPDC093252 TaxID=3154980 RepID=UPI0034155AF2
MPRTYCFVGPSVPDAAGLTAGSGVRLMPPVAAGDLLRLGARAGDTVGIVDGYFHQTGSVRHKEILALLGSGVRVLGAASMGALRAAELDRFGMAGVGGVYADYRDGKLEADDEVTLLHSPGTEGYRALSEPLVCMRATFAAAVRDGVCAAATADRLVGVLAGWPFGRRSYGALPEAGAEAGLDPSATGALQRYCLAHRRDPKREDALLLIDHLRTGGGPTSPAPGRVHRTAHLYAWQLAAQAVSHESPLALLRACRLFADDYPRRHRAAVLRTLAAHCDRECGRDATGATDAERALRHGAHHGLYRLPADPARLGFLPLWLTAAEAALPVTEQLLTALVRSCRHTLRLPWDEEALTLLDEPSVRDPALRFVRLAREVNDRALSGRRGPGGVEAIPRRRILDLLAERWHTPHDDLGLAALDRGFPSLDSAVTATRPLYLFARYNEGLAHLRTTVSEERGQADALGAG